MQRAEFFLRLAVRMGVLGQARADELRDQFRAIQPTADTFEQWAAKNRVIPIPDGRRVVQQIGRTEFRCARCQAVTLAGRLRAVDSATLLCPICHHPDLIDTSEPPTSTSIASPSPTPGVSVPVVPAGDVPLWRGDESMIELPTARLSRKPTSVHRREFFENEGALPVLDAKSAVKLGGLRDSDFEIGDIPDDDDADADNGNSVAMRDAMAEVDALLLPGGSVSAAQEMSHRLPRLTMEELTDDAALWRQFLLESHSPDELVMRLKSLRTTWKRAVKAGEIAGSAAEQKAFERVLGVISLEALWQMPPNRDDTRHAVLDKIAEWLKFDRPSLESALRARAQFAYSPFPSEFLSSRGAR